MKCGGGDGTLDLSMALVVRERDAVKPCVLCDGCITLYERVVGLEQTVRQGHLVDMVDSAVAERIDWRDANTEPCESIDRKRDVDLDVLDPDRILWPELGYRLVLTEALSCGLCSEGAIGREMYWLLFGQGGATAACLACAGYYPRSLVSDPVEESLRSLVCEYYVEYSDLGRALGAIPDVMAVTTDDRPPLRIYEDRLAWFDGEPLEVLTSETVRRFVYDDIARFEMRDFLVTEGVRLCARCGRDLKDGQFSLNEFGDGLFCQDVEECVKRTVMDLEDEDGTGIFICEACRLSLRGREYHFDRDRQMLVCSDVAGCRERYRSGMPSRRQAYLSAL